MSMIIDFIFFCFKQKTAYEMRISDWSSDVCSSDLQFLARETLYIFADLELACDRECRAKMVAGNHLHRNTSGAAFGDRSLGLFTWRIDEAHQAEKHDAIAERSEEHTSELQSLMRISYAVFCLKKKKKTHYKHIQL